MHVQQATLRAAPWREFRIARDVLQAVRSAAPRRVRRAKGQPVLIVPGFGTGDAAMRLLHRDLRARGFVTHGWDLGVNLGPAPDVLRKLGARLRRIARESGQRVHLVGWSMGGVLARAVAGRMAHLVGRVVALGAPLSGDPACSWLSAVVARCSASPLRHRRVRRLLAQSATMPVASIYSRNDGVVHWQASTGAAGDITPIEVDVSHLGMVVNPLVFDAVARALVPPGRRA